MVNYSSSLYSEYSETPIATVPRPNSRLQIRYNLGREKPNRMPRLTASKTEILDEVGYAYSFDRGMYINRKAKKAFSVQFVQDHNATQIRKYIGEHTDGLEWRFYFNSPPSETVKHELECVLGYDGAHSRGSIARRVF